PYQSGRLWAGQRIHQERFEQFQYWRARGNYSSVRCPGAFSRPDGTLLRPVQLGRRLPGAPHWKSSLQRQKLAALASPTYDRGAQLEGLVGFGQNGGRQGVVKGIPATVRLLHGVCARFDDRTVRAPFGTDNQSPGAAWPAGRKRLGNQCRPRSSRLPAAKVQS